MPRPQRSKQLQEIIDDVNPLTVATVVDEYGLTAAKERWHWCAGYVPELAAEGRRMKAAGEKWQRVRRAEEPEDLAPVPPKATPWKPRFVPSAPMPPAEPAAPAQAPVSNGHADLVARIDALQATIDRLTARLAALEPPSLPAAPPPATARRWTFPMTPDLLLRKAKTTTIPTLAMMLGVTGRQVRDAIEEARKAA
ncbi:hypothetical protein ACUXK4_004503 [Methylorubrum extorquens]